MQKKYLITPVIIMAILIASLLALSSPGSTPVPKNQTCCKKVTRECPPKSGNSVQEQTTFDNLSNQFISFPLLSY